VRATAARIGILSLAFLFGLCLAAKAAPLSEYELKAVFLLNFARFNEWPKSALPDDNEPLVIGILGADPFGSALDATVQGELIGSHPLTVRRFGRDDDFSRCHMLFIGRTESARLPVILSFLHGKPVLTVSDIDRFAYRNGMIGMLVERGRVQVQVNLDQAKREQMGVSAKLLKVSLVIRDTHQSRLKSTPILACCPRCYVCSETYFNKHRHRSKSSGLLTAYDMVA
jgi:hypothetical protein